MINEKNYKGVLFDYACEKYGRRFQEFHDSFYDEFPYKYRDLSEDAYLENFAAWLIYEKAIPDTGKTIVEEFVDEHRDMDEESRQTLLRLQNVVRSKFVVLSKKHPNLKLKDLDSGEIYNVILDNDNHLLNRNTLITGRIHPFGNRFKLLGIFTLQNTPYIYPGVLMEQFTESSIADAEQMVVSPKSRLTAVLNKCPSQWVDGICEAVGLSSKGKKNIKVKNIASTVKQDLATIVDSIPEKSREALKLVLDNGGFVKYNKLKNYDDEITFWWKEKPPTSTIGLLRLNGLLVVGKMPMAGRMYRVALIPVDIRDELQDLLC